MDNNNVTTKQSQHEQNTINDSRWDSTSSNSNHDSLYSASNDRVYIVHICELVYNCEQ